MGVFVTRMKKQLESASANNSITKSFGRLIDISSYKCDYCLNLTVSAFSSKAQRIYFYACETISVPKSHLRVLKYRVEKQESCRYTLLIHISKASSNEGED